MNLVIQASSRRHQHRAEENLSVAVDTCLSITARQVPRLLVAPRRRQTTTPMHNQATIVRRIFPGEKQPRKTLQLADQSVVATNGSALVDSERARFSTTTKYFNF